MVTEQRESNLLAGRALLIIACGMVLYHLITTQRLLWSAYQHQMTHLGFALVIVTLGNIVALKNRRLLPLLVLFLISEIMVIGYLFLNYNRLELSIGFIRDPLDWVFGFLLVIVIIEACRQSWGIIFPIIAVLSILYFFFGHLLPYPFETTEFPRDYVLSNLGIGFRGIFGTPLGVSANYIFLFVVFGGLLGAVGAPKFFMEFSKLPARYIAGGTAQTAVVSSALVGMVMGQAVSNVVLTGAFTIPLMKDAGYKPEQAGAIEAAASSGGQIMPPIMGEGIFLMASFLSMAYFEIVMASFIPAFLYFLGVALGVQVLAYEAGIGQFKEKIDMRRLVLHAPLFIVPLAIIFVLLFLRFTPMYAAFYAIVAILVIAYLRRDTRLSFMELVRGFAEGALAGAKIAIAIAVIGIVIQTMTTTGLGVTIAQIVESLSGGQLWVALLLTMALSIFLGCGMPTLAAYAIVAVVVAPALERMGVTPLSAHLFVFWFAVIASVTPPVAFASMAGAALAKADLWKTSWIGIRLAMMGVLVPFIMVYWPIMTLQPQPLGQGLLGLIILPLAMVMSTSVVFRHLFTRLGFWEWLLYLAAAISLYAFFFTKIYALIPVGIALSIPLLLWQYRKKRFVDRMRMQWKEEGA